MPSEIDAFMSASRSTSSTWRPDSAIAVATLTAVVVLPTPPFGLKTAMITTRGARRTGELRTSFRIIPNPLTDWILAVQKLSLRVRNDLLQVSPRRLGEADGERRGR